MDVDEFPERLKQARRQRGMSQQDAGGDRYSGSYISHLESGRRRPTPDVVSYLAGQLGVEPSELLNPGAEEQHDAGQTRELALHEFIAEAAWRDCEYSSAATFAERAAETAKAAGRVDTWWKASYLRAKALTSLGSYDEAATVAYELAGHPFVAGAPELRAAALGLACTARRAQGSIGEAVNIANRAIADAKSLPATSVTRVEAQLAALAAYAESGMLDEADAVVEQLRRIHADLGTTQLAGRAAWALGNIAFMRGDLDLGTECFDQAAGSLRPDADLRLWGRFNKASAANRMRYGASLEGVEKSLSSARFALDLVGNHVDKCELTLEYARLALHRGEPEKALAHIERALAGAFELDSDTLGMAEALRYNALTALGQEADAKQAIKQAAVHFEDAGAYPKALDAWRVQAGLPATHGTFEPVAAGPTNA